MRGRSAGLLRRFLFAIIIAQLGLVSLLWGLVAPIVGTFTSRGAGARIGRTAVSLISLR